MFHYSSHNIIGSTYIKDCLVFIGGYVGVSGHICERSETICISKIRSNLIISTLKICAFDKQIPSAISAKLKLLRNECFQITQSIRFLNRFVLSPSQHSGKTDGDAAFVAGAFGDSFKGDFKNVVGSYTSHRTKTLKGVVFLSKRPTAEIRHL